MQRLDNSILIADGEGGFAATAGQTALTRIADTVAKLKNARKPAFDAFGVGRRRPNSATPAK